MAEKPASDDGTYSEEEAAQRRDATIRAMIGMKPQPHQATTAKTKTQPTPKGRVHKAKTRS